MCKRQGQLGKSRVDRTLSGGHVRSQGGRGERGETRCSYQEAQRHKGSKQPNGWIIGEV